MRRLLTIVALIGVFAFLIGRAVDVEFARAEGGLSERDHREGGHRSGQAARLRPAQRGLVNAPDTYVANLSARSESLYQGRPIRWWARRAVQARRDANARGRTIRRLKRELRRGFIPGYWVKVASCESGVDWAYNGSSGFDGAVQFHPGTWSANRLRGYPSFAYLASPFQQLVVAEIVLAHSGWGQWPACSRKLGLR